MSTPKNVKKSITSQVHKIGQCDSASMARVLVPVSLSHTSLSRLGAGPEWPTIVDQATDTYVSSTSTATSTPVEARTQYWPMIVGDVEPTDFSVAAGSKVQALKQGFWPDRHVPWPNLAA